MTNQAKGSHEIDSGKLTPKHAEKDIRMRKQLYRQLFFCLDRDFDGKLDLDEIVDFLETLGAEASEGQVNQKASDGASMFAQDYLQNLMTFMEVHDVDADGFEKKKES